MIAPCYNKIIDWLRMRGMVAQPIAVSLHWETNSEGRCLPWILLVYYRSWYPPEVLVLLLCQTKTKKNIPSHAFDWRRGIIFFLVLPCPSWWGSVYCNRSMYQHGQSLLLYAILICLCSLYHEINVCTHWISSSPYVDISW